MSSRLMGLYVELQIHFLVCTTLLAALAKVLLTHFRYRSSCSFLPSRTRKIMSTLSWVEFAEAGFERDVICVRLCLLVCDTRYVALAESRLPARHQSLPARH